MKNLLYILISTLGFVACKKEETPQPSQPPQQTQSNNGNNGNGNNGTGNDTTGNDTSGTVKIYYEFITTPLTIGYGTGVSGRDYVQDTTNTRILHNTIKLTNHKVTMLTSPSSIGLNTIENSSSPATPVLCAVGDSIVFEIDSNEVNMTSGATSDRFLHTTIKVWKNAPYVLANQIYSFDTHNYSAHPELAAIYNQIFTTGVLLGTVKDQYNITQTYYIGGKLRLVCKIQ